MDRELAGVRPPLPRATLVGLLVAAAAALSSWPADTALSVGFLLGALWLETFSVPISDGYRFSPAAPLYLAACLLPEVGSRVVASLLLLDLLRRHTAPPLVTLAGHLAVAVPMLASALLGRSDDPMASLAANILVPALYFAVRLVLDGSHQPPEQPQQRVQWRRLQLKIRPLEMALATMGPTLAAAAQASPAFLLAALPMLASTFLAAENILLKASDEAVEQALTELKAARESARAAQRKLLESEREKKLLEGFAQHLASQPELESTAKILVATVGQVMPVDNVAVFLGSPPEPYSYRVSEDHREALQGAALTQIREPLVERASKERKAVSSRATEPGRESLFRQDRCALAVPLGSSGVLYAGRQSASPFSKAEKERLLWLAGKAEVVLEAAYQVHQRERQDRLRERTVEVLQKQVAWLANLVRGAEEMASTLDLDQLADKLSKALPTIIAHSAGSILLGSEKTLDWNGGVPAQPELLATVSEAGRPIVIEELESSRYRASGPGQGSLVIAPMLAEERLVGYIVLASQSKRAFSSEAIDLLFLLASQAAVAFSKARLHQQVVQARRELQESQAQLVQSSKMTAMGQMAAGVAHELNSPLGAIALLIDETSYMLRDSPDLAQTMLEQAQEAVDRSREIVNRLMAYSRPASRESSTLVLADLVTDTLNFLSMQIKEHGVRVHSELTGRGLIQGERQPLQQVLTNLLLNACQAMDGLPSERKTLKVHLEEAGERVILSVTDRGCGIATENRSRIFDPFFTTKPVGRGTGLGLWASHQIVKEHNGTLEVQSVVGQGSRFTVTLPGAPG